MKTIKITLIILVAATILVFIRSELAFHIAKILPFCSGDPIEWDYELAALAMLVLFVLGLYRLHRNHRDDD